MKYIYETEKFKKMVSGGGVGRFSAKELWDILLCQNELNINTISIQKVEDGSFYCSVDWRTVVYYNWLEGKGCSE